MTRITVTTCLILDMERGVHRSWRYCNTRSMRGVDGASPVPSPSSKINLIYGPRVGDVSDIKLIRQILHLILAKRPRSDTGDTSEVTSSFSSQSLSVRGLEVWTQSRLEPPPGPLPVFYVYCWWVTDILTAATYCPGV